MLDRLIKPRLIDKFTGEKTTNPWDNLGIVVIDHNLELVESKSSNDQGLFIVNTIYDLLENVKSFGRSRYSLSSDAPTE